MAKAFFGPADVRQHQVHLQLPDAPEQGLLLYRGTCIFIIKDKKVLKSFYLYYNIYNFVK